MIHYYFSPNLCTEGREIETQMIQNENPHWTHCVRHMSLLLTLLGRVAIVGARDELHTVVEDRQAVHLSELLRVPGNH